MKPPVLAQLAIFVGRCVNSNLKRNSNNKLSNRHIFLFNTVALGGKDILRAKVGSYGLGDNEHEVQRSRQEQRHKLSYVLYTFDRVSWADNVLQGSIIKASIPAKFADNGT